MINDIVQAFTPPSGCIRHVKKSECDRSYNLLMLCKVVNSKVCHTPPLLFNA